jgi:hypothetical protein
MNSPFISFPSRIHRFQTEAIIRPAKAREGLEDIDLRDACLNVMVHPYLGEAILLPTTTTRSTDVRWLSGLIKVN